MENPALSRLTELLSLLPQLEREEEELNSQLIGSFLGTTGDSVRKDISRINRTGRGYQGEGLIDDVRSHLGLDEKIPLCLAGLTFMGIHLMDILYQSNDVDLKAAFDGKTNRIERLDAPVKLYPSWELEEMIEREKIVLGVITTEPEEAEKTAMRMRKGGIKAILNLSGYYLPHRPQGPLIKNINIGASILELICRLGS